MKSLKQLAMDYVTAMQNYSIAEDAKIEARMQLSNVQQEIETLIKRNNQVLVTLGGNPYIMDTTNGGVTVWRIDEAHELDRKRAAELEGSSDED